MNQFKPQSVLYHILLMISWSLCCQYVDHSSSSNTGHWSSWSDWSPCTLSSYCYAGVKTRQRACHDIDKSCCSGSYSELDNCPSTNCKVIQPIINSSALDAPTSSFISQECDTDIKYHTSSKQWKKLIPSRIEKIVKHSKLSFKSGYFNIKYYNGSIENPKLKQLIKICFEPVRLSWSKIKNLVKLNRIYGASMYNLKNVKPEEYIIGFAIAIEIESKNIASIYAAVESPFIGYKLVGVVRWKGQGYDETL